MERDRTCLTCGCGDGRFLGLSPSPLAFLPVARRKI